MAGKSVSFSSGCNLCDSHLESLVRWLSCNGEIWGVGPTAVFASAAALFLYHELESTVFIHGDHVQVSSMEKTLISTMVLGMLALMIHLWVCSMRFFQYYLDTLIRDSPNILLEMTTAGLLGGQEVVPLGPLTKFLKTQQPQIHITVCWFLSLCYADYVRKHYCTRFNMPYLEQWQAELHERASVSVRRTMRRVHSFVACAQQRLRGYAQPAPTPSLISEMQTYASLLVYSEVPTPKRPSLEVSRAGSHVSWGEVGCGNEKEHLCERDSNMCARLVSQSSETTADAIEKLRTYINATRCTCSSVEIPGLCGAENKCTKNKQSQNVDAHI
ncbi:uncharacterized protein LOC106138018 [Amyelois transitella]|uniref:uncharacterized protein LOC106138018 n=1 Tax=Amyelois transitella TaxID=680683 RepID=UPI002990299B|nr:uncharacterized protein LOC106138018 [Amyelois transitella]